LLASPFKGCEAAHNTASDTVISTVIKRDTLHDTIYISYPKPYAVLVHDTVIKDTNSIHTIINDYYAERLYKENYNDSNINIDAQFSVRENKIQNMQFAYDIYRITSITEYKTIQKRTNFELYVGCHVSSDFQSLNIGVNGGIGIKRNMVGVEYGLITKSLIINYNYKLIQR